MLVPEDRKAEVLEKAAGVAAMLKVGDPSDPATMVGPLISAAQRSAASATSPPRSRPAPPCGGRRATCRPAHGTSSSRPVLDVPDNSNPAAQDEIFGRWICVLGYRDVDHAVEIANDTVFGLSGQVFGGDLALATAIAARIRAGAVQVNGGYGGAYASSGGYKQSGIGRERGVDGIRSFQQVKHLSVGNA
jgi:acyl-CoA reductase-like NAD-dependent aldehyde dehydrogenase